MPHMCVRRFCEDISLFCNTSLNASFVQAKSWVLVKAKRPAVRRYTVLSVDGGGLRGAIPAAVLEALEEDIKEYIRMKRGSLDLEVYTVAAGAELTTVGPRGEAWFRYACKSAYWHVH